MSTLNVDVELLRRFERGLDPRAPERGAVPARVLGYGEMSTVLAIGGAGAAPLAYKRLPMFHSVAEAQQYAGLHRAYVDALSRDVGLRLVPSDLVWLAPERSGPVVLYIVQEQLPASAVGHRAIRALAPAAVQRLARAVLRELQRVFAFNHAHRGQLEVAIDGQISNWALASGPATPAGGGEIDLLYFDTSTPQMRRRGVEQLDPELFLRSSPSFLRWIVRRLFLPEVVSRYYDARQVAVDLVANFYKEQRPELVPPLVETVNEWLAAAPGAIRPVTVEEIRSYYRSDIWIWRTYLALRKIDRRLHQLRGREYPYILPAHIKR